MVCEEIVVYHGTVDNLREILKRDGLMSGSFITKSKKIAMTYANQKLDEIKQTCGEDVKGKPLVLSLKVTSCDLVPVRGSSKFFKIKRNIKEFKEELK